MQVATAFRVVNALVAGAVVKPMPGRVAAAAAAGEPGPVDGRLDALRWSARWTLGGGLVTANDAAMVYLMTMKPGLAGSLAAVPRGRWRAGARSRP